jgi:hypothetical protein
MAAISRDAAGLIQRQKGGRLGLSAKTIAIRPDAKKTKAGMSRTDGIMLLRFARIVSHAWVTPTGNIGSQTFASI